MSEVSYLLEPLDDGTRLTIQERQLAGGRRRRRPGGRAPPGRLRKRRMTWTAWDGRLAGRLGRPGRDPACALRPVRSASGHGGGLLGPDVDAVFSALADPTRRRLLDQLSAEGPLTATELAASYPVTRQAVVKHLGALTAAGLLDAHRTAARSATASSPASSAGRRRGWPTSESAGTTGSPPCSASLAAPVRARPRSRAFPGRRSDPVPPTRDDPPSASTAIS